MSLNGNLYNKYFKVYDFTLRTYTVCTYVLEMLQDINALLFMFTWTFEGGGDGDRSISLQIEFERLVRLASFSICGMHTSLRLPFFWLNSSMPFQTSAVWFCKGCVFAT